MDLRAAGHFNATGRLIGRQVISLATYSLIVTTLFMLRLKTNKHEYKIHVQLINSITFHTYKLFNKHGRE